MKWSTVGQEVTLWVEVTRCWDGSKNPSKQDFSRPVWRILANLAVAYYSKCPLCHNWPRFKRSKSRSDEAQVRFGGLTEAAFSTPLVQVPRLVLVLDTYCRYSIMQWRFLCKNVDVKSFEVMLCAVVETWPDEPCFPSNNSHAVHSWTCQVTWAGSTRLHPSVLLPVRYSAVAAVWHYECRLLLK